MKMSTALKRAQDNMQPGVILPGGFLGSDRRALADIIAFDEASLRGLGLGWDELAARMRELMRHGQAGQGETVRLEDGLLLSVDETRGRVASPWEDGLCRKVNLRVERPGVGSIVYNELCIFLAERHHFLQGRGSPFRIEPHQAKAILFGPAPESQGETP